MSEKKLLPNSIVFKVYGIFLTFYDYERKHFAMEIPLKEGYKVQLSSENA